MAGLRSNFELLTKLCQLHSSQVGTTGFQAMCLFTQYHQVVLCQGFLQTFDIIVRIVDVFLNDFDEKSWRGLFAHAQYTFKHFLIQYFCCCKIFLCYMLAAGPGILIR